MMTTAVSRRTLIVEDHQASCEVLRQVLLRLGHEPVSVTTVHQALKQVETFKPTHVLLDSMLPDGNGAEVLAHIRRHDLPIRVGLITAAFEGGSYWEEALRHSPDQIFRKPWNLDDIRHWLEASDS